MYRITVNIFTDTMPTPTQLGKFRKWLNAHSFTLNAGKPNQEQGHAVIHHCHHDIDPTIPCELIIRWDSPLPD